MVLTSCREREREREVIVGLDETFSHPECYTYLRDWGIEDIREIYNDSCPTFKGLPND